MAFSLSCDACRMVSCAVTCFETMSERTTLFIKDHKLHIYSMDHDNSTLAGIDIQIICLQDNLSEDHVSIQCSIIIRTLQVMSGDLTIIIGRNGWTLTDFVGRTDTWTTVSGFDPAFTNRLPGIRPNKILLPVVDLLLYLQHVAVCESHVRFSSCGVDNLVLDATGEFIAIQIIHESPRLDQISAMPTVAQTTPSTTDVIVKYVRSILPLLQRTSVVLVTVHTGVGVRVEYTIGDMQGFILLKDQMYKQ
jgi:hypothetical protein